MKNKSFNYALSLGAMSLVSHMWHESSFFLLAASFLNLGFVVFDELPIIKFPS